MKVELGNTVTLEYTITTEKGELIESSVGRGTPLVFNYGDNTGLLPGLAKRLVGMEEGDERDFVLPPEEAFGRPDSGPTMPMPRSGFPSGSDLSIGARFQGEIPGTSQTIEFEIIEHRADDHIVVRLIPPHAGKTIHIKAKVLKVDKAN